jgi:oligopeptide/dipeptide ABC transporter ATP-binding protein
MSGEGHLLSVRNLRTAYRSELRDIVALEDISFDLRRGEALGLVGESGCGKSTLALTLMGLIRKPGEVLAGEIRFDGVDLLTLNEAELRRLRGRDIAIVFQDPASALNPLVRVGTQIIEIQRAHRDITRAEAFRHSVKLLQALGVPDADSRMKEYPHQLSGGMKQRLCIAIALSCDPRLLIADEPTTALDVTVQAQLLALLSRERASRNLSMLVISHDLGVVARLADRVAILYAGRIVEQGPARHVLCAPSHPYTQLLLQSRPRIDQPRAESFMAIPGSPPQGAPQGAGCAFAPRCPSADARCGALRPPVFAVGLRHEASCWRVAAAAPA